MGRYKELEVREGTLQAGAKKEESWNLPQRFLDEGGQTVTTCGGGKKWYREMDRNNGIWKIQNRQKKL